MDTTPQNKPYEYFAFISYKREDEEWAKWLQKKLESYSLPTTIRKENPELPNKIRPVFRDQSELSGGNLKAEIEKGLNSSKYLIVICSPRSAKSPWVSKEVRHFIDQCREEYIIPFIVGGTPNASNSEEECFPEGLRQLTGEKEILGININEMGRDAASIKVIARMFDLRFDALWRRFERARRIKYILWIAIALAIVISSISFAIVINNKNSQLENAFIEISKERDRANLENSRANQEKARANLERDNALTANLKLRTAQDSIQKVNNQLVHTLNALDLANSDLCQERELLKETNFNLNNQIALTTSKTAMTSLENGNIIYAYKLIKPFIPKDVEDLSNNVHPSIRQTIHAIYDSIVCNKSEPSALGSFDSESTITSVRFSNDGSRLVYTTEVGFLTQINVNEGFNIEWSIFTLPGLKSVDVNPTDGAIAITSEKNGASVYNTNGQLIKNLGTTSYSRSISFSHDGELLAKSSMTGITIYDTTNYEQLEFLYYTELKCDKHIWSVQFNKDSSKLLIATNKECFLYDRLTKRKVLTYNSNAGHTANFSADFKHVIQQDGTSTHIYDAITGVCKYQKFLDLCFSNNTRCWMSNEYLFWGSREPQILDLANNDTVLSYKHGHKAGIMALDVNPKNLMIASGAHDNQLRIWTFPKNDKNIVSEKIGSEYICISPDSKYMLNYLNGGALVLYNTTDLSKPMVLIPKIEGRVSGKAVCFTNNSQTFYVGENGGKISEWNLEGKCLRILPDSLPGNIINSIVISPDNKYLYVAASTNRLYKISAITGSIESAIDCKTSISNLHINNNGTEIISSHASSPNFRIWDTNCFAQKYSILPDWNVIGNDAVYSPSDDIVAIANYKPYIYLIDIKNNTRRVLTGHSGASGVSNVCYIDQNRLASYGSDNFVIIWDIPSGLPLHKYKLPNGYATSCSFIPSIQSIIAGSSHGSHLIKLISTEQAVEAIENRLFYIK